MTRLRVVGVVAAALLVVVVALVSCGLGRSSGPPQGDVPTVAAQRGEFLRRVHAEGNLEAAQATVLSPPRSTRGPLRIAWIADDGVEVEANQVVVRFDPTDLEEQLRVGRVERATSDSRIEQTRHLESSAARNLGRDADLAKVELDYAREFRYEDSEIFSRVEIVESAIDERLASARREHAVELRDIRGELSDVELDLLDIERRKAELKISQAQADLDKLELRAPHAGIFTLKETWSGLPEVGMMVWGGNAVAEIPQLDVMQARVYVLEVDAGGLAEGQSATLTLDAHPDRSCAATVKKVDALAQRRDRRVPVQYFGVLLELERTDKEVMKPGQRVQATLTLDRIADAVTVPRQAVIDRDGTPVVFVKRGADFEPVKVQIGPAGLGRVVIESGIAEGELVALRDPRRPAPPPVAAEDEAVSPAIGGAP